MSGSAEPPPPETPLTATERLIVLTGAVDLRGKLPVRDYSQPYEGKAVTPEPYPTRDLAEINWFVIHHTGKGDARPTVEEVATYQVGSDAQAPFPAVAYTFFVEADGTIELLHNLETVCWANGDGSPTEKEGVGIFNWKTVAACYSGDNPTSAQLAALKMIGDGLDTALGRRLERRVHRQVCVGPNGEPLTECPGEQWEATLAAVA